MTSRDRPWLILAGALVVADACGADGHGLYGGTYPCHKPEGGSQRWWDVEGQEGASARFFFGAAPSGLHGPLSPFPFSSRLVDCEPGSATAEHELRWALGGAAEPDTQVFFTGSFDTWREGATPGGELGLAFAVVDDEEDTAESPHSLSACSPAEDFLFLTRQAAYPMAYALGDRRRYAEMSFDGGACELLEADVRMYLSPISPEILFY